MSRNITPEITTGEVLLAMDILKEDNIPLTPWHISVAIEEIREFRKENGPQEITK